MLVQFTIIALRKLVIPWKSSHVIDAAHGPIDFFFIVMSFEEVDRM